MKEFGVNKFYAGMVKWLSHVEKLILVRMYSAIKLIPLQGRVPWFESRSLHQELGLVTQIVACIVSMSFSYFMSKVDGLSVSIIARIWFDHSPLAVNGHSTGRHKGSCLTRTCNYTAVWVPRLQGECKNSCPCDGIGIHTCFRDKVLWVRVPPWAPKFGVVAELADASGLGPDTERRVSSSLTYPTKHLT